MYCSHCGNIIVGSGLTCTNCGAPVMAVKHSKVSEHSIAGDPDHLPDNTSEPVTGPFESTGEYVTIREREKRIIEEKVRRTIAQARLHSNQQDDKLNGAESAGGEFQGRIVGEETFTGTPEEVAKKKKVSRTKKFLITTGTFVIGIIVFMVGISYLVWRFTPAGDDYKENIVEWMSENANTEVNDFLMNDMKLKNYPKAAKVDFSGSYHSRISSPIQKIDLVFNEGKLSGSFILEGKRYEINGFTGAKGDFILLETQDGIQTATLTGKVFSIGYLSAERNDMNGKRLILSMEKK